MRIPALLYVSTLSQGVPLVVAATHRRARGPVEWVLAWCALSLVESIVELSLALHGIHNLWVPYVFQPFDCALVLWALSCWQESEVSQLTMRLAIVPVVLVLLILIAFFENTAIFSRVASPLSALVGLFAAASTLITKSHASTADPLAQPWFWISAGMALYFGTHSMLGPLSALLSGDLTLFVLAYQFLSVLSVLSFLAIAWGVRCPTAA